MERERREAVAGTLPLFPEQAGAFDLGYIEPVGSFSMPIAAIRPDPEPERSHAPEIPLRAKSYPQLRFMGSKHRLLPWLHEILSQVQFDTALDAFSGSGCVAYLLKCMGKEVTTNDFLNFTSVLAKALVENSEAVLRNQDVDRLLSEPLQHDRFIEETFQGIFFTVEDLRFLDAIWARLRRLKDPYKKALALSALIRSCLKRQPRGVFTVAGDPERYKDGRRDLHLSLREHFLEQVEVFNRSVFDNGRRNQALHGDVFTIDPAGFDLVYMDPPYVPRADDNCYVKRYHFLEGLATYWRDAEFHPTSRVKKLAKALKPFGYRRTAEDAFERLFARFASSTIVLSYSSSGFPDLERLVELLARHKSEIAVLEREHRYHFGTHATVNRSVAREYLILGI